MAVRFILMMALMMVASADPVPGDDIRVYVNQEVNAGAGCGGGCCDDDCAKTEKSCTFDGRSNYTSGHIYEIGCVNALCNNGQWEFKSFFPNCGVCAVGGDPEVYTMDQVYQGPSPYQISATGTYVLFQYYNPSDLKHPDKYFGVMGDFRKVASLSDCSCVKEVTYLEGQIKGVLHEITLECTCIVGSGSCKVKTSPPPSFSGVILFGTSIGGCTGSSIILVGTEGLNVVVCAEGKPVVPPWYPVLPWVYIYASPKLKHPPVTAENQLCGLCNTWTGKNVDYYKGSQHTQFITPSIDYIKSWNYPIPPY